jgi:threonyl-tRNA synthetase
MIMDRTLWERSGHWQNYAEHMFTTASENRDYAIKPMNCPGPHPDLQSGLAQLP